MKRIPDLLILLPILLLLLGATTPIVDAAIVRGDSDASGVVDIADPVSTMMCLYLAAACADCQDSADANDDGAVDLVDVLHTLFFLFEGTPALPPPYPDPGIDTTPDDFPCGADLPTLPDVSGIGSGTFVPENDMEYVVIFQVEDTESGATIVTGLESIANEIFDGEIFVWNDGTDLNWGLNYLTSFDIVEGDIMPLEVDEDLGGGFMEGTFNTTSDTTGTFSMERIYIPATLDDGTHRIVFVDVDDENAFGGSLDLESDWCILSGNLAALAVDTESSQIQRSSAPEDEELGVYTGRIVSVDGYTVELLGLLGADQLILAGTYADSFGDTGFFLLLPPGQ